MLLEKWETLGRWVWNLTGLGPLVFLVGVIGNVNSAAQWGVPWAWWMILGGAAFFVRYFVTEWKNSNALKSVNGALTRLEALLPAQNQPAPLEPTAEIPAEDAADLRDLCRIVEDHSAEPFDRIFVKKHPFDLIAMLQDDSLTSILRDAKAQPFIGKWLYLDAAVSDVMEHTDTFVVTLEAPFLNHFFADFSKDYAEHLKHLGPTDRLRFVGRIEKLDRFSLFLGPCEPRM